MTEFKFEKTSDLFNHYNNRHIPSQDIETITQFLDPDDDPDAIQVFRSRLKSDKDRTKWDKMMDYWEKNRRITADIGGCPKLGSEFVELMAKKWNLQTYITGRMTRDDEEYNIIDLGTDLREERTKIGIGISDDSITDGISIYNRKVYKAIKEKIKESIKFDGNPREEIWQILEEVAFVSVVPGFAVAGLKKIIHSVKRKLHRKDVFNHIMAIITGIQGGGKGTFIEQFSKPIAEVTTASDFDMFLDPRNMQMWENYLCTFEECEKAGKSDMNGIKKRITDKGRPVKPLYSNSQSYVTNNLTCIGDANESVDQIFNDPTGMRRMMELQWKLRANSHEAWTILNEIDWGELWKSIDEDGPDPLDPFRAHLIMQQKEITNEEAVEKWLLDEDRDERRILPRLADKTEQENFEINSRWEPDTNKQAEALWTDNFYPWLKAMYPHYKYSSDTFVKKLHHLYRTKADYLGLGHSKPKNKSMWKYTIIEHPNPEDVSPLTPDEEKKRENSKESPKTPEKGVRGSLNGLGSNRERVMNTARNFTSY